MSDNNSDFRFVDPLQMLNRRMEEQRTREAEAEFHYAGRKARKEDIRSQIETAAMRICAEITARLDDAVIGDVEDYELDHYAQALGHAAAAMHAAESYSNMRPVGNILGGL